MPRNSPMPGETWRSRELRDKRVTIDKLTSTEWVHYQHWRGPWCALPLRTFLRYFEWEEAAE